MKTENVFTSYLFCIVMYNKGQINHIFTGVEICGIRKKALQPMLGPAYSSFGDTGDYLKRRVSN
jgi:hypothetical protein